MGGLTVGYDPEKIGISAFRMREWEILVGEDHNFNKLVNLDISGQPTDPRNTLGWGFKVYS